ncbi:MAG: MFS transporter, partial [Nanoarchaeota archaeon]
MKKRNPLFVILFTVFLDMLGIGILIPVIPILLADPTSPSYLLPAGISVQSGYILLGFLIAIFPFMVFLSAPILGQLSDRYGRKKILVICLFGTCISYLIFAIAILTKNIPLLFISRAFDGITGGNISVAQAVIADITPPEKRSRTFGLIGAAFGFGFVIGPFLGGVLADYKIVSWFNAATPFWFAALLSFINIILLITNLTETHTPSPDADVEMNRSIKNIVKAFSHADLKVLFFSAFLFQAGFAFYLTFFSVFLIIRFHATPGTIGLYFAYIGVWIVIAQAFVTRQLSHRFREDQVLRVSMLGLG